MEFGIILTAILYAPIIYTIHRRLDKLERKIEDIEKNSKELEGN